MSDAKETKEEKAEAAQEKKEAAAASKADKANPDLIVDEPGEYLITSEDGRVFHHTRETDDGKWVYEPVKAAEDDANLP